MDLCGDDNGSSRGAALHVPERLRGNNLERICQSVSGQRRGEENIQSNLL